VLGLRGHSSPMECGIQEEGAALLFDAPLRKVLASLRCLQISGDVHNGPFRSRKRNAIEDAF
jgi:hypothetical protein